MPSFLSPFLSDSFSFDFFCFPSFSLRNAFSPENIFLLRKSIFYTRVVKGCRGSLLSPAFFFFFFPGYPRTIFYLLVTLSHTRSSLAHANFPNTFMEDFSIAFLLRESLPFSSDLVSANCVEVFYFFLCLDWRKTCCILKTCPLQRYLSLR